MVEWIIATLIISPFSFWFLAFCVPKLKKWRELKDEIVSTTTEYGHFYSIPIDDVKGRTITTKELYDKIQQKLRKMAGEVTTMNDVPLYKLWLRFNLLPSKELIEKLRGTLIGWSNSLVKEDWNNLTRELFIEEVRNLLTLPNSYKELKELQKLERENARNR